MQDKSEMTNKKISYKKKKNTDDASDRSWPGPYASQLFVNVTQLE